MLAGLLGAIAFQQWGFLRLDSRLPVPSPPLVAAVTPAPESALWQVGHNDRSLDEFTQPDIAAYTIPDDWQQRDRWDDFPRGLVGDRAPIDLHYTLATLPAHGVEFSLRVLQSKPRVPNWRSIPTHSQWVDPNLGYGA
ncbi:MAG: hypothetical protein HC881_19455 [Leptolyngbyaceae cyanobacterium SL_7_1]|nr:hypothetical protein [Leptolyngbyaceae cyanobacterium SL_7_1]